ncbi:hypothetical protein [Nostoc sp. ChiSLP03a]|uniref:hypothetical protein n=1 Tax=Nostoc sp. ChiSLP03a TaxID=3075380 RepID=UPI002AD534AF|nr:hypothetical protein [Nostoc sp. ChiSLP03a]MDZ8213320.1 hypothetical protein [Nostoc sp. ChiSLP03a]
MLNSNEAEPFIEDIMLAIAQEYQCLEVFPKEKGVTELADVTAYTGMYTIGIFLALFHDDEFVQQHAQFILMASLIS